MSASAEGSGPTTKAITSDPTSSTPLKDEQKPAAALEEDDEFEDFPVEGTSLPPPVFLTTFPSILSQTIASHGCERQANALRNGVDWPAEEQEVPGEGGGSTHLWEESWDDDDTSEDFSKQLKAELDKVKANKS
ncbi:MAG: hypothetical protein Q9215_006543 [Flavoplaca cf. flavocitrina]